MFLSSYNIGYAKLIEMNMEADPNLPPIASKPYMLPLMHQLWARKELEDSENGELSKEVFPPMVPNCNIA